MYLRLCWLVALVTTACTGMAWADPVAVGGDHWSQLGWSFEPWVLASLVLAVTGYVLGLNRMSRNARSRVFGVWRGGAFAAGSATLVIALISPLDALDDQLFSAHMLQHLLLMMVAAPLLVWGRPAIAWLWAFPLSARRAIGRLWMGSGLHQGIRLLMRPWVVWVLCSVSLWFWHLPGPYGWALASEAVHTLEHLCFFIPALMFWSLVLEPLGRRRLDYGPCILFVATLGVQNGLLGALLTFAGRPLYAAYAQTTVAWGLTPLEDQQLAGIIMWVPASVIHLTTLAALFVAWMHAAERQQTVAALAPRPVGRARVATASRAPGMPYAVLPCVLVMSLLLSASLVGCQRAEDRPRWQMRDANAANGPALIVRYGCGACHDVPGVDGANGHVGPPLTHFGHRVYIAGVLHNTPDNLIRWLRRPQSVVPGNAMPDMGVTEQDARDIAAYLYTLS